LDSAKKIVFGDAKATKPTAYYVSLAELSLRLGWKNE